MRANRHPSATSTNPHPGPLPEGEGESARAKDRYRRIALSGAGTVMARGISILTTIFAVPLCLHHLGAERCGIWMTITSLLAVSGFADLGIGSGLTNAVSEAHGRNDRRLACQAVSTATFLLAALAVLLMACFAGAYAWVPWAGLLNAASIDAAREAGPAMAALAICVLLNVPLGVVSRIQLGYQEGFLNSIWESMGNLLALAAVVAAIQLAAPLPWLVLATAGPPLAAAALNAASLFGYRRPWLRPAWSLVSADAATKIVRLGVLFFVLYLTSALLLLVDNLLAAHLFDLSSVPQLAAPQRLFALPLMALAVVLTPLWPAYAEAIARGDLSWVRKTLARSLAFCLGTSGVAAVGLFSFGRWVVQHWIGPEIECSTSLLAGLAVLLVMQALGAAISTLLNAASLIGFQVTLATTLLVMKALLSTLLARYLGLAGIVWGTATAYALFVLIPYAVCVPRILSHQLNFANAKTA